MATQGPSTFAGQLFADADGLLAAGVALGDAPGRERARLAKNSTEEWALARHLSALAASHRLAFPVIAWSGERPDFTIQTGTHETGLEVTQAVDASYARFLSVAARAGLVHVPDAIQFLSLPNAAAMSGRDMEALVARLKEHPPATRWPRHDGDPTTTLKSWLALIGDAVTRKIDRYMRAPLTVERCDLLIYDNTGLNVELGSGLDMLGASLPLAQTFERVYLLTGAALLELDAAMPHAPPVVHEVPVALLA